MTRSTHIHSRCEFTFADGRRCRLAPADPQLSYCLRHLRHREIQDEAARVGEEIIAATEALDSQQAIHKALGNVFRLLAHNRISSRNAAVLGYIAQLMLGHCPSVERTLQSHLPMLQFAMKMRQQMDRSESRADQHERHLLDLQFDLVERVTSMLHSRELKELPLEDRKQIAEAISAAFAKKEKSANAAA